MASGLGLFMGNCSGHGLGSGSSHHPGLGGGTLPNCPHVPLDPRIKAVDVKAMDAVTLWPPIAQLPLGVAKAAAARVVVNGKIPMVDQDILTPHPTPTQHTTTSTGDKCFVTLNSPAFWCTKGIAGGRESPTGHGRKVFSTAKTVFIGGVRVSKFGDKLGDGSTAFPCNSVVTGCSINVFVEMSGG
jgi:hypothetical protein